MVDLDALIEEAIVDAHGEEEQLTGFRAVIEEGLAAPPPEGAEWISAYRRWAS